ncbi:MAG: asparagine synthase-related protein [Candidatus Brocadiaceae bacterium]|jgi:asparagine synthase (glutamine-hydrolysing)
MAELMGFCGPDRRITRRVLDRMARHMQRYGEMQCDRWEDGGAGVLRYHHGSPGGGGSARSADGSSLLFLDGDLYGWRESSRRLGLSDVASGPEFVLRLYEECGESAFTRLNGSFALCLWDGSAGRLLLATDRHVSRPIYYCATRRGLAFGTRFNGLLGCGLETEFALDVAALMQFLTFQHVQLDLTFMEQVRAMLPGSVAEWQDGNITLRRYWRPHYGEEKGTKERFAGLLASALRRAAGRATHRVKRGAVFLSGGVDSRTVAAAMTKPMTAVTVGDWLNREVRVARRVAHVKRWPHLFLQRTPDHYARLLEEAVELTGGMSRFDHCHFLGQLDQLRDRCDIAYVEEPMDVLFKGYYWRRRPAVRGLRIPLPLPGKFGGPELEEQLLRLESKSTFPSEPWRVLREPWRSRYGRVMTGVIRRQIADADTDDPYHIVEHVAGRGSYGRTSSFANLSSVGPHMPCRAVSLDRELLELSLRTPVRFRRSGDLPALALKRLAPRLHAVPLGASGLRLDAPAPLAWLAQAATEGSLRLRKILGRVPRHYSAESWPDRGELLRTEPLRAILERTLSDACAFPPDFFDSTRLRSLAAEHVSGTRDHRWLLLCLLTFGTWFRKHGAGVSGPASGR